MTTSLALALALYSPSYKTALKKHDSIYTTSGGGGGGGSSPKPMRATPWLLQRGGGMSLFCWEFVPHYSM